MSNAARKMPLASFGVLPTSQGPLGETGWQRHRPTTHSVLGVSGLKAPIMTCDELGRNVSNIIRRRFFAVQNECGTVVNGPLCGPSLATRTERLADATGLAFPQDLETGFSTGRRSRSLMVVRAAERGFPAAASSRTPRVEFAFSVHARSWTSARLGCGSVGRITP